MTPAQYAELTQNTAEAHARDHAAAEDRDPGAAVEDDRAGAHDDE
jgi:hypothetical protein